MGKTTIIINTLKPTKKQQQISMSQRKLIGSAKVVNGKAEFEWNIGEGVKPGLRNIWVSYTENDGYMLGEAYEKAYIRGPTETLITIPTEQQISSVGDTVTLTADVTEIIGNQKVTNGNVRFLYKTEQDTTFKQVQVGEPEEGDLTTITDGQATVQFTIPDVPQSQIEFKAEYLENKGYGYSETETLGKIRVRGTVEGNIEPIRANRGENVTLTAFLKNKKDGQALITNPAIKATFLLDGEDISLKPSITGNKIEVPYTLPETLTAGEHTLTLEVPVTDDYDGITLTGKVYIREKVNITPSVVYAGQSSEDKTESATFEELSVVGDDGNPLTGNVKIIVGEGNNREEVSLTLKDGHLINAQGGLYTYTYNIPLTYNGTQVNGKTRIPYTITFEENDGYEETTLEGIIDVKARTVIQADPEGLNKITFLDEKGEIVDGGVQGGTIRLVASIVDEDGSPVDGGYVNFYIDETNDEGIVFDDSEPVNGNGSENNTPEENREVDEEFGIEDLDKPVDDEF